MKLDYTWDSLTNPGEANDYFCFQNTTPIEIGTNSFTLSNAWWLAEISRLIYHNDFFNKPEIDLGCFNYELLGYIEKPETSTHIALIKIIQESPCLVIVFRGSDEIQDWNINTQAFQTDFNNLGKIHSGFKKAFVSIRDKLIEHIKDNELPFFITGHSLGAALANLATSELHTNKNFDSCYTFGSPRIGNMEFINSIECKTIYRIVNNCDIVTTVPIDFTVIVYKHLGFSYLIDDKGQLITNMNEDEIYLYQKERTEQLKEYALSKLLNNDLMSIKNDLPPFLADHSPVNYVYKLQNLLK
jgi:triacylglycerol lipase